jgi:hypothetical protein
VNSPLDQRMRTIAREEATAAMSGADPALTRSDRVADLEQAVNNLRERLERLEQAPTTGDTAKPRRAARKTAEPAEPSE